jgi:imidazole glycerol phosphate synthase subunit HisF
MLSSAYLSRRTVALVVAFGLCLVAAPKARAARQQGQAVGQITVSQAASVCTYSLNPGGIVWPGTAGSGSTQMTAGAKCSWSAVSNKNWIHTSSGGIGNGMIVYTVDANTGQARSGSFKAGGQSFTVYQSAGCQPGTPGCKK